MEIDVTYLDIKKIIIKIKTYWFTDCILAQLWAYVVMIDAYSHHVYAMHELVFNKSLLAHAGTSAIFFDPIDTAPIGTQNEPTYVSSRYELIYLISKRHLLQ